MTPMQLSHLLNLKQKEKNKPEKDLTEGLQCWIRTAYTRDDNDRAGKGSMLGMKWKSCSYVEDEAFSWTSKRLGIMIQPWRNPRNVENMNQFSNVLTKITEALYQQTIIVSKASMSPTVAPSLITTLAKHAPGALSKNQIAKLLAL